MADSLPNPILQGFSAVRRDPAVFLLEILWRWSFAAAALLLLFCAGFLLLDRIHTDSLVRALESKDPRMIGTSLLFTWLLLGIKAIAAAIALGPTRTGAAGVVSIRTAAAAPGGTLAALVGTRFAKGRSPLVAAVPPWAA